jgi:hypothetical protein
VTRMPRLRLAARALLTALLALAALAALPDFAVAQRKASPPLVKYGKWPLLLGSVGMNLLAAQAHRRADDAYDALRTRCDTDNLLCTTEPGSGNYADAESERLYQRSLKKDREARLWLLGGETALLGAATMFIWELARPKGPPGNVPFDPQVTTGPGGETRLGLRIRW